MKIIQIHFWIWLYISRLLYLPGLLNVCLTQRKFRPISNHFVGGTKTNKRGNLFSLLGPPTYLVLIKIQWNSIHKKVFLLALRCRDFKVGPPNNLSAYLSIIFPDAANFLGNAKDNWNPPAPPIWFCIKVCMFSFRDFPIYFGIAINAQRRTDWWGSLIGKVRTLWCGLLPSHPILEARGVCNMPWVAGWSVKIMDGTSSDASLIQSFVTHSCNASHNGQKFVLISDTEFTYLCT